MIVPGPKGKDLHPEKQEGDGNNDTRSNNFFKEPSSSSSRQWQSLSSRNNPRIVRVSHAFRGKDRHSKVSTVKGLRDRRIRLSVPTAIQLYDLQDKLGVGQPSKVIDWLLDASKHDINTLPPLQVPLGSSFGQFHEQLHMPAANSDDHGHQPSVHPLPPLNIDSNGKTHYCLLYSKEATATTDNSDGEDQAAFMIPKSKQPVNHDAVGWRTRRKEIEGAGKTPNQEDGGLGDYSTGNSTAKAHYAQNLVPMAINNYATVPGFSNNAGVPYAPFSHWPEPPSLCSSSQFGTPAAGTFPPQAHQYSNSSAVLPQSSSSASPATTLFPSYTVPYMSASDPRSQITPGHLHLLMSTSSSRNNAPDSHEPLPPHGHHQRAISSSLVKSFPLMNVNTKLVHHLQSIKDDGSQENKDDTTGH